MSLILMIKVVGRLGKMPQRKSRSTILKEKSLAKEVFQFEINHIS